MRPGRSRPLGALVRGWALVGCLVAAGCSSPAPMDFAAVFDGTAGRWIDLSWSFGPSTIYWPTDTLGFRLAELAYGRTEAGYFYSSYELGTAEHGGTHLDAPIHFAEGGLPADEIPLTGLIGPAAVVDVQERAHPDYLVTVVDLEGWEAQHGELPDGGILLLRTGWGSRWGDRTAYLGTEATGPDAVPQLDYGQSADFRSHVTLYSANISGFENVANLELMPESGAFVVALPMKIEGGSGGPLRIVGFVPSPGR
jgi:kynurenine formamidase